MLYDAYIMLSQASPCYSTRNLRNTIQIHTASFGPVLGGSSCFGLKETMPNRGGDQRKYRKMDPVKPKGFDLSFKCESKSVK